MLLTPTTAVPAFAAAGPPPATIAGEDMRERFGDRLGRHERAVHHAGQPLLEPGLLGAGRARLADGLPVGLQIMGRRHADDVVLRLARLFEQVQPLAPPRADRP